MKKKIRLACLIFVILMLSVHSVYGRDDLGEQEQVSAEIEQDSVCKFPKTIKANLWDLVYDEQDGWVYGEDDLYDSETFSEITMSIPKEGEDESIVSVEIYASIEGSYSFRDYLTSNGFDEYEYAVNQSYELTDIGGLGFLKKEVDYWGSPCLRYLSRAESASATVMIQIFGEYNDERVDKLMSGLTFRLEDIGNEDGPWYWEGTPFSAQAHSVMVGTYTLDSQWIPITDCIMTKEIFNHAVAVSGNQVFLLVDGALKRYDYDGTSLIFAEDIILDNEYERISSDLTGTIWLSNFMEPLISLKDGVKTASYEGTEYVAMHPSGTWGVAWFSGAECKKIILSDGTIKTEPIVFKEVDLVRRVLIDENHIYVSGSAVDDDNQKVFIYDAEGSLQMTLTGSNGESLGSVTFVTETENGYLALDGNMREVVLWTKDGTYIGKIDDIDLFDTEYPWLCDATKLSDGSILVIMTDTREDESAQELIAFKLSGF